MAKKVTAFACDICKVEYGTLKESNRCEKQGFNPTFKVGDIGLCKGGFGWYDGNALWISNPGIELRPRKCPNGNGNCFSPCCTFEFWYVVTFIDDDERDKHRPRYHLYTGAMSGKRGYASGYTFDVGHHAFRVIKPSAKLLKDSKRFIGKRAKFLV